MALECLGVLDLSLSQVIEADNAILVAGQHELVFICEIAVKARCRLVIRKDRCLRLLAFNVENTDLMVRAPGNQH